MDAGFVHCDPHEGNMPPGSWRKLGAGAFWKFCFELKTQSYWTFYDSPRILFLEYHEYPTS